MTASIGIWAQGEVSGESVLYKWEADQQTGFVTFEASSQWLRPADSSGQPIGDLVFDPTVGASLAERGAGSSAVDLLLNPASI